MEKNAVIMVTGAAGFIASCLLGYLNNRGFENIIIVDDFSDPEKTPNWSGKKFIAKIEREELFDWLISHPQPVDFVFHLGARTDTTEFNYAVHQHLNVDYSKQVWNYCSANSIPLVYASSASTYGSGEFGYDDDHELVEKLKPLNPYGISKNEFDKWAVQQTSQPPFWAGLKFFNVYGPNEYHKARMASVIFHAFNQVRQNGKIKLFRSHKTEFKDGEQLRDFVYVVDVINVCEWLMENYKTIPSGLYNLGTGKARTFNDLAAAIFNSLGLETQIEYIATPEDIRDKYQYFTEANMKKLRKAGYTKSFQSLEEGIREYVNNYLRPHQYY